MGRVLRLNCWHPQGKQSIVSVSTPGAISPATIWSVGKSLGIKDSTTDEDSTKEKDISKDKFREIKTMLLDSRVHILDECHLAACETVQAISHHVKAEHFYGMSASPWRDDGSDMLIESVLRTRRLKKLSGLVTHPGAKACKKPLNKAHFTRLKR